MGKYIILLLYVSTISCSKKEKNGLEYFGKWDLVADNMLVKTNKQWFLIDSFGMCYCANLGNKSFIEKKINLDSIINCSSFVNENTIICDFKGGERKSYVKSNKITNQYQVDSFLKVSILDCNIEKLLYDKKWILDSISAESSIMLNLHTSYANRLYGQNFTINETILEFSFNNQHKERIITVTDTTTNGRYLFSVRNRELRLIDIDFVTSFDIKIIDEHRLILIREYFSKDVIEFHFKN